MGHLFNHSFSDKNLCETFYIRAKPIFLIKVKFDLLQLPKLENLIEKMSTAKDDFLKTSF